MGERLTKDYERAIREALASCRGEGRSWSWGNAGPFATVDETAEALAQVARNADGGVGATNLWCVHMPDPNEPGMSLYVCHTGNGPTSQAHARFFASAPNAVRMLLDELDALRAAPPTTYLHADGTEEPIGELVARLTRERDEAEARVRELEAERDGWRTRVRLGVCVMDAPTGPECWCGAPSEVEAGLCLRHTRELERLSRAEKAEATLAETRAQLARLREAAEAVDEADASGDDTVLGVAIRNLRDALSTPGPTLAEIRREADDTRSALVDHAQAVSARVAEWPEWKKREINHFAIERERRKKGGGS